MLNRRLFVGGLSASVPLLWLPGAAGAQPRQPRLHAMVVGINEYLQCSQAPGGGHATGD